MTDFIAQHRINVPGSYAAGYFHGDPITEQVVRDWGLAVPDDVLPADGGTVTRPADDNGDRNAWEAYVVSKGTGVDEAKAASLDDLRGMYEPDPKPEPPAHDLPGNASAEGVDGTGVQNPTPITDETVPSPAADPENTPEADSPERPAESARKSEWVLYVSNHPQATGEDQAWAGDDDTTKADLIAWKPGT